LAVLVTVTLADRDLVAVGLPYAAIDPSSFAPAKYRRCRPGMS
jgi:hypothetical protein